MAAASTDAPSAGTNITPIALLDPGLPDVSSRVVTGEITITWPFSIVSQSVAFVLAEPDFRLRRDRGQVRVEFQGAAGKAVEDLKLGGGDHARLSLEGVSWEAPPAAMRLPGTSLGWQLKFHNRLRMTIERAETNQTETVDITSSPDPIQQSIELPKDVTPPADLGEPIATPIRREPALLPKRLASVDGEEYASPAFVKRARVSYGALFEGDVDIFDQDVSRKTKRKKSRFSMNNSVWRYSSRSPSPEKEEQVEELLDDDEDESVESDGQDEAVEAVKPVDMVDEACQTKDTNIVSTSEAVTHEGTVIDASESTLPAVQPNNEAIKPNPMGSTTAFSSSPPFKDSGLTGLLQGDSYDFAAVPQTHFLQAEPRSDNVGFGSTSLSAAQALDAVLDAASQSGPAPSQPAFGHAHPFAGFGGQVAHASSSSQRRYEAWVTPRGPTEAMQEPASHRHGSNVFAMSSHQSASYLSPKEPAAASNSQQSSVEIIDTSSPVQQKSIGVFEDRSHGEEGLSSYFYEQKARSDVEREVDELAEEESHASRGSSHLDTGYKDGGDIRGKDYDLRKYDQARSDDDDGSEEEREAEGKLNRGGDEELLDDEMEDEEAEQGEMAEYDEDADASSEEAEAYAEDENTADSEFGGPESEDELELDEDDEEDAQARYDESDAASDPEVYEEDEGLEEDVAPPTSARTVATAQPKQQAFISLLSDSEDEAPPPRPAAVQKLSVPDSKPDETEQDLVVRRIKQELDDQAEAQAWGEDDEQPEEEENEDQEGPEHDRQVEEDKDGENGEGSSADELEEDIEATEAEGRQQPGVPEALSWAVAEDPKEKDSAPQTATGTFDTDESAASHTLRPLDEGANEQHLDDQMEVDEVSDEEERDLVEQSETVESDKFQISTGQPGEDDFTPQQTLAGKETARTDASTLELGMEEANDEQVVDQQSAVGHLTTSSVRVTDVEEQPPPEKSLDSEARVTKTSQTKAPESSTMPLLFTESATLDAVSMSPPTALPTQATQQTTQSATLQEEPSHTQKAVGSQVVYEISDSSEDKIEESEMAEGELELSEAVQTGIEMAEEGLDSLLRDGKPHGEGVVNEEEDISTHKTPSQRSGSAQKSPTAITRGKSDASKDTRTESAKQLPTPIVTQDSHKPSERAAVDSEEVDEEEGPDAQLLEEWESSQLLEPPKESEVNDTRTQSAGLEPTFKQPKSPAKTAKPPKRTATNQPADLTVTTRSLRSRHKKSASIDSKVSVELGTSPARRSARRKSNEVTESSPKLRHPDKDAVADTASTGPSKEEVATKETGPSKPSPLEAMTQETRSASGSFRLEAKDDAQSAASSSAEDETVTSLKVQLNKSLRSSLPEALPLRALRTNLHKTTDIVALVAHSPSTPVRPKTGPRDYLLTLTLVDPSLPPSTVSVSHIFRPFKKSLPTVREGDVVLLRRFTVISVKGRGFGTQTTDESAWAVFERNDEEMLPQINGPPVEVTDEEYKYAEGLRRWWGLMGEKGQERLKHAGQRAMQSQA